MEQLQIAFEYADVISLMALSYNTVVLHLNEATIMVFSTTFCIACMMWSCHPHLCAIL